jgi:hypothetical protein
MVTVGKFSLWGLIMDAVRSEGMQDYLDEMNPTYLVTIKPKGYSGFYW